MLRFRHMSIKQKLIAIGMLTSTVALVLACSAFGIYEVVMFRGAMTSELSTLAGILGANATAALSSDDRKAATEDLAWLGAKHDVVAAFVYDGHGRVFASYVRDGRAHAAPQSPGAPGSRFVAGGLRLVQPILLAGETVGALYIESDLQEMYRRLEAYAAILIWVFLAASMVTLLLSSRLQRMISEPILELTRVTNLISDQEDYSVRAALPNTDEFGRLAAAFNQMTTQLQRSRAASRENAFRMEEAQHIAKMGSWEWNIVEDTVLWSDELYRIFGLTPGEFGGTYASYLRYVHPADHQLVGEHVERALREKIFPAYTHRVLRADGDRIIHASGVVVSDATGRPIRMTGVAQDVTEAKQMEMDLKLARDAALESARIKSEFLANMSHEIRTPMNGVIGMTELLLDTELTGTQREFTNMVRASAESLLCIINDILDFSKIEAGKLHFESIVFDPRSAAEGAVELLAEQAAVKGVELNLLVDDGVPAGVCGDPGRLQQVLTNLVSNAVKFTQAGEITVGCEQQGQTDSHVLLRFTVTDTGIGISEPVMRTLFQPFVQGDGSTTRQYGGTGLGLVICKQLVEMMGGEIGVESQVGRGSRFYFTVSMEKDLAGVGAAAAPTYNALHGLRVLVVDDNATNRKILVGQTAGWGMLPAEAESAARALERLRAAMLRSQPYDVALLDLDMPGMNGVELARAIRSEPALAAMRLILMPSVSDHAVARAAQTAGIDACLRKPVRRAQLFEGLQRVMRPRAAPDGEVSQLDRPVPVPEAPVAGPPVRVLVAEDNLINQTLAAVQLRKLGYSSEAAVNGRQALDLLFRAPYSVVLMDCQMPEMDGYEATREIRRREGGERHTVIIAMTANSMEGDREKCLAAGMDDYLAKPVKLEELRVVLDRWQSGAPHAAQSPRTDSALDVSVLEGLRALQDSAEPDLVRNLISLFLNSAPAQLAAVRDAVERSQADALVRLAHGLRGASGNLGASGMARTCAELEKLGRAEEISGAPDLVKRLEAEFEHIRAVLSAEAERSA